MIPIRLVQTFPAKQLQGFYCLSPFIMIEIMIDGSVRLCGCADWMPAIVGNLFEDTLENILASPLAQDIRQSIIDGSYHYCNERTCGILLNNGLNTKQNLPDNVSYLIQDSSRWDIPYEISLSGDLTCNLSCPSCRTKIIQITEDQHKLHQELGQRLAKNLFSKPTDRNINIIVSNSGEIFASSMLLEFVTSIDKTNFPNVKLNIQTNGLLAPKRWKKLGQMQDAVTKTTMTLDAARPHTYEQVRRGGRWKDALVALEFFKNKQIQGMKFHLRMVVQDANWQEMKEFYDLAKNYNADVVEYVRLVNWYTWSDDEFKTNDVFDVNHSSRSLAKTFIEELAQKSDVFIAGDFG